MGDLQPPPYPLNQEEVYYLRQSRVTGWGPEGQKRLKESSVLVVGAGGLGCPALTYLAGAGIGRLGVADPDRVSLSNLPRQTLFTPGEVGKNKAQAAALVLQSRNPFITLEPYPYAVDSGNVKELVEGWDLILDGCDNFSTRFLLHDACRAAGKPLVTAALHQWEAQVQVFDFRNPGPGCLRCLYPEAPVDGCVGTCGETGVAGALAGAAGSLQALAAVQVILGLETLKRGESFLLDFRTWATSKLRWKPDPRCSCQNKATWDFLKDQPAPGWTLDWENLDPRIWPVAVDLRSVPSPDIRPLVEAKGLVYRSIPLNLWERALENPGPEENGSLPGGLEDTPALLVCGSGVSSRNLAARLANRWPGRFTSLAGGVEALGELTGGRSWGFDSSV